MEVKKRNGVKEPVSFDKITNRLRKLKNEGNLDKVDPVLVAQKVIENLYDGITTFELDEQSTRVCAQFSSTEPEYGSLGSRICVSNLHKSTPSNFSDCIEELMLNKDRNGNSSPIIDKRLYKLIIENKDLINSKIINDRDYLIDYFGFKTLEKSYLMKSNGKIVERPQYMWMRVSLGIHYDDFDSVFETYDLMSKKYFTHASPTLFNSGTIRPQLSSCFLMGTEDSIGGIYKTIEDCAKISKNAGGIGVHVSNIRASGSLIRKTNGTSSGIKKMLQVYNYTARHIDQGGKRPGSFAMYLEPWHADVFEFLDLRKNTGSETDRARDLFLALWVPDLFMKKVIENGDWYLMCPDESKGLADVYGDEFEKLYNSYIEKGKYRKKILARDLLNKILDSQVETGNPYLLYKDHINKKSNQQNLGVIKSSNLCAEIVEYSDHKETAVCNLASIALNAFVEFVKLDSSNLMIYSKDKCEYCKLAKMLLKNYNIDFTEIKLNDNDKIKDILQKYGYTNVDDINTVPQIYYDGNRIGGYDNLKDMLKPKFNFNKLYDITKVICKNLNKVIDVNYYPIKEAKFSNMKHRPIGIGIQGLSDTYMLMRIPFESEEALKLNNEIFETIYYASLVNSMELARERENQINEVCNISSDDINLVLSKRLKERENNKVKSEIDLINNLFNNNLVEEKLSPSVKEKINKLILSKLSYQADDTYDHFLKDVSREKYKGAYHTFVGSPLSKGIFQFDMWNIKPSSRWDWNMLRELILKYGVRNSLVTALMPTASTAQILGNNSCFEALQSNIYKRKTQAGEFKLVNKYLIKDLKNLGNWNEDIKNNIIYNNGSVNELDIPKELKDLYKIVWEIRQKSVILQAAGRGPFIDQTQSMNIFMEDSDFNKMTSCHIMSWKLGLKTGIYYFHTKPKSDAIKFTINENQFKKNDNDEDEGCLSCSA